MILCAEVHKFGHGKAAAADLSGRSGGVVDVKGRQPSRVTVRERLDQDSVDCTENDRRRTDPQSQRQSRHCRKRGALTQRTNGISKVLPHCTHSKPPVMATSTMAAGPAAARLDVPGQSLSSER